MPAPDQADPRIKAALDRDRRPVREAVAAAGLDLKSLQTVDWRQSARHFLIVWAVVAAIVAVWSVAAWPVRLLLVPCMAIVQHAMLNLVHEASHHLVLADRRWNDRVTDLLAGLPIGHTVASYRMTHADHHRYLRSRADPSSYVTGPDLSSGDIRRTLGFLLAGRLAWELVARSLLGRRFEAEAAASADDMKATDRIRLVKVACCHVPLGCLAWATGFVGLWITWLVVVMTITPTLEGIRTMVEHRFPDDPDLTMHTRSHHRSIVVSGLMAPFFQYHWEHHLFPTIPHHRLADLHALLIRADVAGAKPVPGGFLRVLFELA